MPNKKKLTEAQSRVAFVLMEGGTLRFSDRLRGGDDTFTLHHKDGRTEPVHIRTGRTLLQYGVLVNVEGKPDVYTLRSPRPSSPEGAE